jgi:glycosyltransferase involved in cell wall biosynthesis
MKLGIISDAHHYYNDQGELGTLSLLARQFEQWADIFDQVVICAPLISGPPRGTYKPYEKLNISLLPVENAGGNNISAKVDLIIKSFEWWKKIKELLKSVDAVHIRCPNNISIPGLLALPPTSLYRHAVYTGSWIGHDSDPVSYRLQRYYLKHFFKGPVSVYGNWPDQPDHIIPSFSPSYSNVDWEMEIDQVNERIERLKQNHQTNHPIQILTVGSLNKNKNQALVIRVLKGLLDKGYDCFLTVIGDGIERDNLERLAGEMGIIKNVKFTGLLPHEKVRESYRRADFVIQAPYSEGFGKVPIEAMFHGAVPILSDVDMSSQLIGEGSRGKCFEQDNINSAIEMFIRLLDNPHQIADIIINGRDYTQQFTLEIWKSRLISTLNQFWETEFNELPKFPISAE